MTPLFKGFLVILAALGLWALANKALAGTDAELKALIGDKAVVYVGTCYFKEDGNLTFKHAEMKTTVKCVVGMTFKDGQLDSTKHYIMLFDDESAVALLVYDETTKTQETLWKRGKDA